MLVYSKGWWGLSLLLPRRGSPFPRVIVPAVASLAVHVLIEELYCSHKSNGCLNLWFHHPYVPLPFGKNNNLFGFRVQGIVKRPSSHFMR